MFELLQRNTTHSQPAQANASSGQAPFFSPADKLPTGDCTGWVNDKESLTKRAVQHYVSQELGLFGVVKSLTISTAGKWYVWTVETPTETFTVAVAVQHLPAYLIVRKNPSPDGPRCEYGFTCSPNNDIQFVTLKCEKK